ncbi:MAG: trigger factor [Nitrospinae bacterium]|nr:trigger factor [Nitrospinota bacterium]
MTIEIETIDSCNKKIKIDIPHQDYLKRVDAQYVKVGQHVQLPGFRKGKVPKSILEKRFGPEVKREVLTQLISERLADAIEEKGIKAVSPPSLLNVHAEEGTDINVSASVEVLPDIAVKDYSGIELGVKINRVADKDVEDVIAHYRQRAAKNVPVTDRPARDKDFVKIDFQGTIDGQPISGGAAKDFILQIGSKESFVEFNEGATGMRVGEEKTIRIGYPKEYGNPELAGKTADYRIVLKDIQVQELPAVDDEFAKSADPAKNFASLDDMKNRVRQELEEHERKQGRKTARSQLADRIVEMNPLDIPEGLVQEQVRFMIAEARKKESPAHAHDPKHEQRHADPLAEKPATPEEENAQRPAAMKILQQELLVSQLADDLNIEVTAEELDKEIDGFMSLVGGGNAQKIKYEWNKNGTATRIRARMRREKTLETLLDKIRLKEEMVDRQ